ncbi:MAG: rod-binding protein [Treponema sp.]|jgi:flagellar protein FlgJ|nr:rod-binding protein [Treponema sp.]
MEIRIDNLNTAGFAEEKTAEAAISSAKNGDFDSLIKKLEQARENAPAKADEKIDKTSKLYEQCQALESFLVKNLFNSMRATVQKSGFIDGGFAGDMYEDMLYDEYAKAASFGLADLAYLELTDQRGQV